MLQIESNDANHNLNVNGYAPLAGQWLHLAVQNDVPNNTLRVYVNGDSTALNPGQLFLVGQWLEALFLFDLRCSNKSVQHARCSASGAGNSILVV